MICAFLISYPPLRQVGADLATHRNLLEMAGPDGRVIVYAYEATEPFEHEGVQVRPLPGSVQGVLEVAAASELFVTHPYGSGPLRAWMEAMRRAAPRSALMVHSASAWMLRSLHDIGDRYDRLIANSQATAAALGERRPVEVVHPRLHPLLATEQPLNRYPGGRPPRVLFCNPIGIKGADVVATAMQQRPHWSWTVVAGGYGEQQLGYMEECGATVIGNQLGPAAMRFLYLSSDVLVQPSRTESYGMTALEARTAGCPVVATDLPGVREALDRFGGSGVHWISAPPTDRGLLAALDPLLQMPADRAASR